MTVEPIVSHPATNFDETSTVTVEAPVAVAMLPLEMVLELMTIVEPPATVTVALAMLRPFVEAVMTLSITLSWLPYMDTMVAAGRSSTG